MRLGLEECDLYRLRFMAGSNHAQACGHHWKVSKLVSSSSSSLSLSKGSMTMKRICLITVITLAFFAGVPPAARAQGGAKQGPDVVRDPDMEKDSLHNLEVARQYFKLRKAYKASLARCEEIIAGNPTFSKIDEVLLIAGQSSLRLSENKGKQSVKTATDKLREDGREYLSM